MFFTKLFAIAFAAASLAACAQSSVVSNRTEHVPTHPKVCQDYNHQTPLVTDKRVAVTKKPTPFSSGKNADKTAATASGLASFYTEGTQTANGEKFNTHEFTAAHRTLPFGTRLRVTNLASGRYVTVRVNDRGPFVRGRVVDVSYSAAETLGVIGRGVARVKLDVVR